MRPITASAILVALTLAGCSSTPTDTTTGSDGTNPTATSPASGTEPAAVSAGGNPPTAPSAPATSPIASRPSGGTDIDFLGTYTYRDSIGYFHVVGEVVNNGPQNAQFVQISGTFYDSARNVAETGLTFTTRSIIPAGERSPFDIAVSDAGAEIVDFKLTVSPRATNDQPVGAGILAARGMTDDVDSIGYFHVRGEVVNHGSRGATFVKVIAAFYNESGGIVGEGFTYTQPSDIAAGESAPFDVSVDSDDAPGIARYEIYVEANALR